MLKVLLLGDNLQAAMAAVAIAQNPAVESLHWRAGESSQTPEFITAGPEFKNFLALLTPALQEAINSQCLERLVGMRYQRQSAPAKDHIHTWSDYGAPYQLLSFASAYHASRDHLSNGIDHYCLAARFARQQQMPVASSDANSIFSTVHLGYRLKGNRLYQLLKDYAQTLGAEWVDEPSANLEENAHRLERAGASDNRIIDCRPIAQPNSEHGPLYRFDYSHLTQQKASTVRDIMAFDGGLVVHDATRWGTGVSVYAATAHKARQLLKKAGKSLEADLEACIDLASHSVCYTPCHTPCENRSSGGYYDVRVASNLPEVGLSSLDLQWLKLNSALTKLFLPNSAELAKLHDQQANQYSHHYLFYSALITASLQSRIANDYPPELRAAVASSLRDYDSQGLWRNPHTLESPLLAQPDCLLAGLGRPPENLNVKCSFYATKELQNFCGAIDNAITQAFTRITRI